MHRMGTAPAAISPVGRRVLSQKGTGSAAEMESIVQRVQQLKERLDHAQDTRKVQQPVILLNLLASFRYKGILLIFIQLQFPSQCWKLR